MGSGVSVKQYCENTCCPEEFKLLDSFLKDNTINEHEKENISYNKDNSNYDYNKKITNLFKVNNDDNNISNSLINKEEIKEKDEIEEKNNNEDKNNKINFSFIENYSNKNVYFNTNGINDVSNKNFQQTELLNSNKIGEFKINSGIKSNLKQKPKTIIINKKKKNSKEKKKKKNHSKVSKSDNENSKIKNNKNKVQFNIKRESEIVTNFEEEKNLKNNGGDNINNLYLAKKNNESLFDSLIIQSHSSNLLNIVFDTINISEESFRSVQLKSNKFQNDFPSIIVQKQLDNDFIKGNFLMKKMKFKYQGNKDPEGKKLGFGIILYEDKSKLIGNFFDSKLNGIVYFYNCGLNNSTYIGEYMNNIPVGYGIYSRQGLKLEGNNWNKNYINNIGIAIWDEGEIYEGEFQNNLKEGIGTYRWEDGAIYMGHFQNNQINGYGVMNFANGNSYMGEFNKGYLSGWGKFTWEDGKIYIGNYKNNKKNGFGIFIWNYEPLIALIGFWENGKQNGTFVKLSNGHSKYYFYQNAKKIIEIGGQGDICSYLRPSQMKYKNFFKKSYHQFEYFVKSSSKW